MPRVSLTHAAAELARRDPVIAGLVERGGPIRIRPPRDPDHFVDLAETIVYQQLAGAAASAIWRRVAARFDGAITPEAVLAVSDQDLLAAGLSRNKIASMRDLAAKVADGTVPLQGINRLKDDEVVERLSLVRGIGRWTAEMFQIWRSAFTYGHPGSPKSLCAGQSVLCVRRRPKIPPVLGVCS